MLSYDEAAKGALSDIRVLDLSRLVAGNMTTHLLADFGADVIKIERPGAGDDLRNWRVEDVDIYWKVYARNKRSIALNIKDGPDRAILEHLIGSAQVLVENFLPGTLEAWGLGPEALHEINPKLIVLRISGWGQTGLYNDRPGFGTLVEAMSGWAWLNGDADGPPTLPPLAMADMVAGLYGASAVLIALRAVEANGQGQVIDVSLFEAIFSLIGAEAAQFRLTGTPSMRAGNQASHTAPRNVYPCADGRYLAISGSMQSMAMRIFDTIGRGELKDDLRFSSNDARIRNRDELNAIIGGFVGARTLAENLALFEAAGVTAGPVYSIADLVDHPYVQTRAAIVELPDAQMGSLPMHNVVARLSQSPGAFRRPAPKLDEHRAEILAELQAGEQ